MLTMYELKSALPQIYYNQKKLSFMLLIIANYQLLFNKVVDKTTKTHY